MRARWLILLTTFAVLSLFIAIMVDAMSAAEHVEQKETRTLVVEEHQAVMSELQAIRSELAALRASQFPNRI